MHITEEEVLGTARLARLRLDRDEARRMAGRLDAILGYVRALDEVDTTGVEPMCAAPARGAVFREDRVRPSLERDEALANAPESNGAAFVVPRVI